MYADKESRLIYESYINEGIHLRGPEGEEALDKWQEQLDEWRNTGMLDEIQSHNKHIFKIVIDEAKFKIYGDDTIIYLAPVQQVDIKSGQKNERAGVLGVEQALDGSIIQGYKINNTDMNFMKNWWAPYHRVTKYPGYSRD